MLAVALGLFVFAAERLVRCARLRDRLVVTLALGLALYCAASGALDAAATHEALRDPLVFVDPAGGSLVVREEREPHPLARPLPIALVAAALALGSLALRPPPPVRRARRGLPLVVAASALPYLVTLAAGLGAARGYDALWYHLPAVVAFARTGALLPPGRDLVFYFPADGELLGRAAFELFGPRSLGLLQWPFAFGAAAAAAALARAIGARRASPRAAALVLAAPLVLFQSAIAYVDVLTLFFVAAAALVTVETTRARGPRRALRALVAGTCLGVAIGAKYAALPLAACLAPPLLLYGASDGGRVAAARLPRALLGALPFAVGALVPSWFWFARNLRLTGNPLFPIHLPSLHLRGLFAPTSFNAGKELDFVGARWQWLLYPWTEQTSHESGFGAAFACIAPIALVVIGLVCLARARRGRLLGAGLPLGWGALYLGSWWVGTPHEPRHLLPLLVLFGAPAMLVLAPPGARTLRSAFSLGIAVSLVISLRVLCFSPTAELSGRPADEAALYDLPPALASLVPPGALVANRAGRPYNYPLARRWRLLDYAPRPPSPADLDDAGVDFLFYRGPRAPADIPPGWTLRYESPVGNPSWWESRPGDVVALYGRPTGLARH